MVAPAPRLAHLTIKQLDQKQKVITAEVPSTTYQNGIYNLRLTLDDITERSEWNVVLINGTPHFGGIMDYFTPKFWFAMTASPERTDDFDIYKLFDYNINFDEWDIKIDNSFLIITKTNSFC